MKLKYWIILTILLAACGGGGAETTTTTATTATSSNTTSTETTETSLVETTTTTAVVTTTTAAGVLIRVEAGAKVEGPDTVSVSQGEVVTFRVVTDVADEVHVHGYDLFFATSPGEPVTVEFTADATGIFEVELEGSHLALVDIEVTP